MRTLVVHCSAQHRSVEAIRKALTALELGNNAIYAEFGDAEKSYCQSEPHFVIVSLSEQPEMGLEVIQALRGTVKGYILAAGGVADPKMILRAMQFGADVFLDQADLAEELEAALSRFRLREEARKPPGRTLGVISASGGCGASTLAVNIAAVLAKERGKSLLIDMNPGRGDLASLLDLKVRYTLKDVCEQDGRLDRAMLEQMLGRHSSGIHLLGSPTEFEDVHALSADGVGHALTLGRKLFSEIVVDVEDCFHSEQNIILQQATGILLVARLDFTSLRNARRILAHLMKLGVLRNRIKVVINLHGQLNELPIAEAEEAVGEKLNYFVPYDAKTILRANNTGQPAVLKDPGSKVAISMSQVAKIDFEKGSGMYGVDRKVAVL